jgi:hypothetical protein
MARSPSQIFAEVDVAQADGETAYPESKKDHVKHDWPRSQQLEPGNSTVRHRKAMKRREDGYRNVIGVGAGS